MSLWVDFIGSEIRTVEVDGVATRLISAGEGTPTWVLLHGRGGHVESWRENFRPLADAGSVVAFDLLGHGLTAQRAGADYTVTELVAHAIATIDELGLENTVLVGQSLGGWAAAHVARERPDLVSSLVLIEPAGMETEAQRQAAPGFKEKFDRGGRAFEEPTTDAVRDRLVGLVADSSVIDDEMVDARRALYAPEAARDVHKRVRAADNEAAVLTPDVMAEIEAPILVVHGALAHQPLGAIEASLSQCPDARIATIPGVAQWPQLERPGRVNDLLLEAAQASQRA